jgi:hypothetical protein
MKMIEMQVLDTFYFKDGRTVFVGYLEEPVGYIKAGTAELRVGDRVKTIAIEDEMVPSARKDRSKRSISTLEPLSAQFRQSPAKSMRLRIHTYRRVAKSVESLKS